MYKIFLRVFFFISGIFLSGLALGQDSLSKEKPPMADGMRSDGKIYVVVAVLVIILMGIFLYLIQLDRKLGRLEKNNK